MTVADEIVDDFMLEYELAQAKLEYFCRSGPWEVVEGSRPYRHNWHIEVICEHLEALFRYEIKRMVINVPYRAMKSLLGCVMLPSWAWIHDPNRQFVYFSHGSNLAIRDAVKSRRVMQSDWYQAGMQHWGVDWQFATDQNVKSRYENTLGGHRLSFGITGGITGESADIIVGDDPHDINSGMYSDAEREQVLDAFDQGLANRLNDPDNSAILIIMQRLHQKDLAGHVLEEQGYHHLCIPQEYEPGRTFSTAKPALKDPRSEEGELMWPARFHREWVDSEKERLGTYGTAAQFQQRPSPMGGGIIKTEWLGRYDALPDRPERIVLSIDTANKAKELADYSVIGTWLIANRRYYLADVWRRKVNFPDLRDSLYDICAKIHETYGRTPHSILIEDKASGTQLIQVAQAETTLPVIPIMPEGDKETRMFTETPALEAGRVWIPAAGHEPWVHDFIDECENFPVSEHKDQVDMLSQFLRWVAGEQAQVIGTMKMKGMF